MDYKLLEKARKTFQLHSAFQSSDIDQNRHTDEDRHTLSYLFLQQKTAWSLKVYETQ